MKKTEKYNKLLKKLYFTTGIPIAIISKTEDFRLLYPELIVPVMEGHSKRVFAYIDEHEIEIGRPHILKFKEMVYYALIRLDENLVVQLGPVANVSMDFTEYLKNINGLFTDEQTKTHIRLIQGAPRCELNYFVNICVLAVELLLRQDISNTDIQYGWENEFPVDGIDYRISKSPLELRHFYFSGSNFEMIKNGDVEGIQDLIAKFSQKYEYYFFENDITSLRVIFISYGAICCHTAATAGVDETELQKAFQDYVYEIGQATIPASFMSTYSRFNINLARMVARRKVQAFSSPVVRKCQAYITHNLYSRITIQDLEEASGNTRRTILRHFKEGLGVSPSAYILDEKLKEAANLLLTTDLKASDIAAMVDFSSQSHLNRVFEKKYGCTPIQYKKRNKTTE